MAKSGRYTERSIGSQPKREEAPKEEDPKTEAVRAVLRGNNPFAKKYPPGTKYSN